MTVPHEPLRIRLTLDKGLAAWLRALCASPVGIFGDERETIIYLVRNGMRELAESEAFREAITPHLPEEIRKHTRKRRA
jgi:hypothetical protein